MNKQKTLGSRKPQSNACVSVKIRPKSFFIKTHLTEKRTLYLLHVSMFFTTLQDVAKKTELYKDPTLLRWLRFATYFLAVWFVKALILRLSVHSRLLWNIQSVADVNG